jgi:hypothetical protein
MATYSSPAYSASNPVRAHGEGFTVQTVTATVTCTAAPSTSDTINFFYLPANARVVGGFLSSSDMDTNGTPTLALNIGDSGSASRYFSASTVGQAGTASTAIAVAGLGYLNTSKTLVTGVASNNAATGAAGTVTLNLQYVVEDSATS